MNWSGKVAVQTMRGTRRYSRCATQVAAHRISRREESQSLPEPEDDSFYMCLEDQVLERIEVAFSAGELP